MRYFSYLMLFSLLVVSLLLDSCKPKKQVVIPETNSFTTEVLKDSVVVSKDTLTTVAEEKIIEDTLRHLDTAKTYIGTKEKTGYNDGINVEKFLKSVGRSKGDAWCAAFVSYCLTVAKVKEPTVRSGLARNFKLKTSIKANDVLLGTKIIPDGSLIIWEKGSTISGHIGFVEKWNKISGKTIEGNTSSGKVGSQSDGDGVYVRTRYIEPANYFRITSFTLVF